MKTSIQKKWIYPSGILISIILLASSGNAPDGNTGAPFDGICSNCHGGGSYQGNITIDGIPSMIDPNTTYPVTVTIDVTSGSPPAAGFQVVVVNQSNQNNGNLTSTNGETGTSFFAGREYLDQRGPKAVSGGTVSWNFEWTSPNGPNGTTVNFYFAGNMVNNTGSSSGDAVINSSFSGTIVGGGNPLMASIPTKTNVSCFGESDGTATASATGGNPPYTYEWSNGSSDNPVTGLSAGAYIVTVTDNSAATATASTTITQPPLLTHVVQITRHVTCPGGRDGSATVNAFGGTPPYTFIYSSGSGNNLSAGMYGVTVTDSKNCQDNSTFEILQPENYAIEELQFMNPLCPDDSSGTIQVLVTGATPPYKYKWSSGETTASILNKTTGGYTITITDAKNCAIVKSYTLTSQDTISPILIGKNGTVYLDIHGNASIQARDFVSNLSDNCDATPALAINQDSFSCSNVGTTDYFLSAQDQFGNKSFDTIQITILDTFKPMISIWQDTSFSHCNIVVPVFDAMDACGIKRFEQTAGPKSGDLFPVGISVLEFFAEDQNNNSSTAKLQVNVINPLTLALDSFYFEKCYGDKAMHVFSFENKNKSRMVYINQTDTIVVLTDSLVISSTNRPDSIKSYLFDTTGCAVNVEQSVSYPDSIYTLDSVVTTDQIELQNGSLTIYPTTYDSIQILDRTGQVISTNGQDLPADLYYVKLFKDGCEFIFGPYVVKLIISTEEKDLRTIRIQPNPFTTGIHVKGSAEVPWMEIRLFNFQGNQILTRKLIEADSYIDLSEIAAGPYYLMVKTGIAMQQFKLVKL
ncbi:MAG: T9SS type A sorting domain-containing protein [Saprospiraceae bacterium]|nr:T9SS type A sorting domain-containing protein [Saprospiraceae bacterium]